MRSRDMSGTSPSRSLWRFFPWFVTAGIATVVAVNVGMVAAALSTFPGKAGGDGFDLSNHYNTIIDRVEQQGALGWSLRAEVDAGGHPVVLLKDRSGDVLAGADIDATARRPVGDPRATVVRFTEASPGRYVGSDVLDEKGQWDLLLSATAGGQAISATRRVLVR